MPTELATGRPEKPVSQLVAEAIKADMYQLWGDRMPTWEEFKRASQEERLGTNKVLAVRVVSARQPVRGVPKAHAILYGLMLGAAYLAVPVLVVLYFLHHVSGWWALGSVPLWWVLVRLAEEGMCDGIRVGAEESESLYLWLVNNGAFLFGPAEEGAVRGQRPSGRAHVPRPRPETVPVWWNALATEQRHALGDGLLTALLRAHWPTSAYYGLSIVLAVTVGFRSGIGAAFFALGASWFSVTGAPTLKSGLLWAKRGLKGGPIVLGIAGVILGYWFGSRFGLAINGHAFSGEAWAVIGAVIGFVFTDRKLGDPNQPRWATWSRP